MIMNLIHLFAELGDVQTRYTQNDQKPIQQAVATFKSGYGEKIEEDCITVVRFGTEPLTTGLIEGRIRIDKDTGEQKIIVSQCDEVERKGDRPINRVVLTGRAGRDPEVKYFESGAVVAKFTLAVDRNSKTDKDPDWFNLEAWNKTAQIAADYVRKGSLLEITGEMKIERWTDKEGKPRSKVVVKVDRLGLLGSKKDNEQYQQQQERQPAMATTATAQAIAGNAPDIDYEDIPF